MEQLLTSRHLVGVTRLLIMQPTAFCNIACDYCYLPHRNDKRTMSHDVVAAALDFVLENGLPAKDFTIVWHAGEPLVLPPSWYEEAFALIRRRAPDDIVIPHAMQTNGMLINDAWCDLFLRHKIRVGVSLDGPAFLHDPRRRTRSGSGTHATALRGLRLLKQRGVDAHAICVVTRASLSHARDIIDFFHAEGVHEVGFNIEEIEGVNGQSTLDCGDVLRGFEVFVDEALSAAEALSPPVQVREYRNTLAMMRHPMFGRLNCNSQNMPFAMLTVGVGNELFTFSPELAGLSDGKYGDFVIGNLPGARLDGILANPAFNALYRDILQGVGKCRETCDYFDLCLGGAPVNKLAELGTFDATETLACRLSHQVFNDVSLRRVETMLANAGERVT